MISPAIGIAILVFGFCVYCLLLCVNARAIGVCLVRMSVSALGIVALCFDDPLVLRVSVMIFAFIAILAGVISRREVQADDHV